MRSSWLAAARVSAALCLPPNMVHLQVHCLGFSKHHDAAFLTGLTLAGSERGSFQYVPEVGHAELAEPLERVTEVGEVGG